LLYPNNILWYLHPTLNFKKSLARTATPIDTRKHFKIVIVEMRSWIWRCLIAISQGALVIEQSYWSGMAALRYMQYSCTINTAAQLPWTVRVTNKKVQ